MAEEGNVRPKAVSAPSRVGMRGTAPGKDGTDQELALIRGRQFPCGRTVERVSWRETDEA